MTSKTPIRARPAHSTAVNLPKNPKDPALTDELWAIGNAEARTLRLAHRIHTSVRPQTTILFGSRAKGTHREDSDTDLILVFRGKYDERYANSKIDRIAAAMFPGEPFTSPLTGRTIVQPTVKMHVITINGAAYRELLPYRNNYLTEALLTGVVIARDPERWTTPYAADDPPPARYDPTMYQNYRDSSLYMINLARTARFRKETMNDINHNSITSVLKDAEKDGDLTQKQAMMITRDLSRAMHAALISAIYASGGYHRVSAETKTIYQQAVAATSEQGETIGDFAIPIETWLNRTAVMPDNLEEQWETALADVQHVRKVASRINRRLSRQAS